jgi:hypothetical protein
MKGILIFNNVQEAIHAGYSILSPCPDSEGFLHARTRTAAGFALALVRLKANAVGAAAE